MTASLAGSLAALIILFAAGLGRGAGTSEISGQVLDREGRPVAGIEVSTFWRAEKGRWVAQNGVRTDDDGRFALQASVSRRASSLMALDDPQQRGAVVLLDEKTAAEPLRLTLQPTTLVRGAFESRELGHEIESVRVSFTWQPAIIALASRVGAPSYGLRLPPGDYKLTVQAVDCRRVSQRVTTRADLPAVDLGTKNLEPTIIARHYGKPPPPLHVTDARGVDPSITLADYAGRWVLLEFWGFW